ncbi:MAG: CAP domain-containing protein [Bacteroidota bacterium]
MKIILYLIGMVWLTVPIEDEDQTTLSEEEIEVILERHNYWRADVGIVEKLEWSNEMAELAADWAKKLKKKGCAFEHRTDNKFGENLFKGTSGAFDAKYVVDAWASEKEDYNYNRNKCKSGKMCGHYTQIVWQNTKKVGCAKIVCDGMDIWVCNYDPPGNWVGEKPY